jgi:hypothetical protein
MKMSCLVLVVPLAGCLGLAAPAIAKGRNSKAGAHIEQVYLINDGKDILIDPIPNRLPSFSSFRIRLNELGGTTAPDGHREAGRSVPVLASLAQNPSSAGRHRNSRSARKKRTSKISAKPARIAFDWGEMF